MLVTADRLQAHNQGPFPLSGSLPSADSSTNRTSFLKNSVAVLFISQFKAHPCAPPALLTPWYCLLGSTNKRSLHCTGQENFWQYCFVFMRFGCTCISRERFSDKQHFFEKWLSWEYEMEIDNNKYSCKKALSLESVSICSGQNSFIEYKKY